MHDEVLVTNGDNVPIGYLIFRRARGIEWQEFKYTESWIEKGRQIDPEIPLFEGVHRSASFEFGCFSDAAPDSWGRALIKLYTKERKNRDSLFASGYLLSVSDRYRIGDFRFFDLNNHLILTFDYDIPKTKDLSSFQLLIEKFQKGESIKDDDFLNILGSGSSLGGARPKLSIINPDSTLWLAKFTSVHDVYDNPAREALSLYLAKSCLPNVPDFKLIQVSENKSVVLIKRFDRNGTKRIPYLSAKTFLRAQDGVSIDFSYLDIAEIIESTAYNTAKRDLVELFKRLVFNVLIGNKDDHLRNHGFLYIEGGWRLSPVFDLEISPEKFSHALALDDTGSLTCSLEKILQTSEYYGLSRDEGRSLILGISDIVFDWETAARKIGISARSIKLMPRYDRYVKEVKQLKSAHI